MSDQIRRIDENSQELIKELAASSAMAEELLRRENPHLIHTDEALHRQKLFEGWAIQKISGLQIVLLDLVKKVETL